MPYHVSSPSDSCRTDNAMVVGSHLWKCLWNKTYAVSEYTNMVQVKLSLNMGIWRSHPSVTLQHTKYPASIVMGTETIIPTEAAQLSCRSTTTFSCLPILHVLSTQERDWDEPIAGHCDPFTSSAQSCCLHDRQLPTKIRGTDNYIQLLEGYTFVFSTDARLPEWIAHHPLRLRIGCRISSKSPISPMM